MENNTPAGPPNVQVGNWIEISRGPVCSRWMCVRAVVRPGLVLGIYLDLDQIPSKDHFEFTDGKWNLRPEDGPELQVKKSEHAWWREALRRGPLPGMNEKSVWRLQQ